MPLSCTDPGYSTYLDQFGKVKRRTLTCHPSEEEEKMIIQNWKSSWDTKILGPTSVKTQLKAASSSQQSSVNLEIFLRIAVRTALLLAASSQK